MSLSRRELNPGPERLAAAGWRLTSSYTNHYTTEDLQVLSTCRRAVGLFMEVDQLFPLIC
jgi:hypothetical protein